MPIITRPFKVDDTLTLHGITGIVFAINLGNTQLATEDGQQAIIPNRKILGEILTNSFKLLVVVGVLGVSLDCGPERAIRAVRDAIDSVDVVSRDRTPQVGMQAFGSPIGIGYRYWIPTNRYYTVQHAVNLAVFKSLKHAGLTLPFPQRDARLVGRDEAPPQAD